MKNKKSFVVHTKKEEAQQSVWFPQKTTAYYLGDWEEEKWDKKVFWIKFLSEKEEKKKKIIPLL